MVIEILSPDQSSKRVTASIAHCLKHGCQLGWPIDPKDRSILVFTPNQFPELCLESDRLVILETIPLSLTPMRFSTGSTLPERCIEFQRDCSFAVERSPSFRCLVQNCQALIEIYNLGDPNSVLACNQP